MGAGGTLTPITRAQPATHFGTLSQLVGCRTSSHVLDHGASLHGVALCASWLTSNIIKPAGAFS